MKIYRDENGRKLYPVCSWSANQHKLYNALDRASIRLYECNSDEVEAIEKDIERIEHALDIFNSYVHNNLVYATYEDGLIIKDYVWRITLGIKPQRGAHEHSNIRNISNFRGQNI